MAIDIITKALANKYTNDSADALGAVKGAPCTIKSVEQVTGGNKITFEWTSNSGTKQTTSVVVKDGTNGTNGINGTNGTNGTNGEDGEDGFSPTVTMSKQNGVATITITDVNGSHSVNILDGENSSSSSEENNFRWKHIDGTIYPNAGYAHTTNTIDTLGNQYTCLKYVLNNEKKVKISCASTGAQVRVGYCFVDSNGNVLLKPDFVANKTYKNIILNVPENAYCLYLNGNGYQSPYLEVSVYDTMGDYHSNQYVLEAFGRKLQYKDNFSWLPMPKGMVAFTFDDSLDATGDIVDLFISKNVPCCFGAVPEKLNMSLGTETIAQAMQRGVEEVGCEVLAHGGYLVDEETIQDENFLFEKFVIYHDKLVKAGFTVRGIVRTGGTGNICNSPITDEWVRLFYDYSDLYGVKEPYNHARVSVSTKQGYFDAIDAAATQKKFSPILFHQPPEYLEELIDYAISKGVTICNYATAYDTYGSTVREKSILSRLDALESIEDGNEVEY